MIPGFDRAAMMAKLNRLREVMPEEKIFLQRADGALMLSPLAAKKLAEMDAQDQEDWRDAHRAEAAAVVARLFADGENAA
ncbi:hypothetical protein [Nocardia sp. NPDC049707]|uniref:hypothetical protein n=1 Tax=Nocardia sp. NPDC049707 TaxID=3154735 RepID=UPI0034290A5A